MPEFLAAALSLPTVVFTVMLGCFLVYALLTLAGALDIEWLDGLLGIDDVDDSFLASGLQAMGVAGIPITIFAGVSCTFAWLLSIAATKFLPDAALVKVGAGLGAAILGMLLGSRAVRPFRQIFVTTDGPHREQLVGKICTIRSLQVDDARGTAEIGDLIAEVRCFRENALTLGSKAIVYDYDTDKGIYHVGPIDESIADVDKVLARTSSRLSALSSEEAATRPGVSSSEG